MIFNQGTGLEMKKFLFLILIPSIAWGQSAEGWYPLGGSGSEGKTAAKLNFILNKPEAKVQWVASFPRIEQPNTYYLLQYKIDCSQGEMLEGKQWVYDFDGKLITAIEPENQHYEAPPPNSILEAVYDFKCKSTLQKKTLNGGLIRNYGNIENVVKFVKSIK